MRRALRLAREWHSRHGWRRVEIGTRIELHQEDDTWLCPVRLIRHVRTSLWDWRLWAVFLGPRHFGRALGEPWREFSRGL